MTTRREKLRQATIEEIKAIAWEMLKENQPVTIHRITREMGMTAPAFYTYFNSRDALMTQLVSDALDTFYTTLSAPFKKEDTLSRLKTFFIRYRDWAVSHPNAFALFAGHPVLGFDSNDISEKALELYRFILGIFHDADREGGMIRPDIAQFSQAYTGQLESIKDWIYPDLDLSIIHWAIRVITQIHGLISMELSGRFSGLITAPEAMYLAQLNSVLWEMGLRPE